MKRMLLLTLLLFFSGWAMADWREALPQSKRVGQGEMTWFGLSVYDAELWSSESRYDPAKPYALLLKYKRNIAAKDLVSASFDEMRKLGAPENRFKDWESLMNKAFVDVKPGDQITGVNLQGNGARFFAGDRQTLDTRDAEFARWFFSIWMDPKTSEPKLRKMLIGEAG